MNVLSTASAAEGASLGFIIARVFLFQLHRALHFLLLYLLLHLVDVYTVLNIREVLSIRVSTTSLMFMSARAEDSPMYSRLLSSTNFMMSSLCT